MADRGATRRRAAPTAKNGQRKNRERRGSGTTGARQSLDRYLTLARAAAADGDAVASESYYQHADHYYRVMREAAS